MVTNFEHHAGKTLRLSAMGADMMWMVISTLTVVVSVGACAAAVMMQPTIPKLD
jgi:hypothetical protein